MPTQPTTVDPTPAPYSDPTILNAYRQGGIDAVLYPGASRLPGMQNVVAMLQSLAPSQQAWVLNLMRSNTSDPVGVATRQLTAPPNPMASIDPAHHGPSGMGQLAGGGGTVAAQMGPAGGTGFDPQAANPLTATTPQYPGTPAPNVAYQPPQPLAWTGDPTTSTDLSPEQWQYLSTILGTDAKAAYQRFIQQYQITYQQVAGNGFIVPPGTAMSGPTLSNGAAVPAAAAPTGTGPSATPGASATPGTTAATAATAVGGSPYPTGVMPIATSGTRAYIIHDPTGDFVRQGPGATVEPPPTPQQYAQFLQYSTYGVAGFMVDRMSSIYMDETGQAMPTELRQQMLQAAQGADEGEKEAMIAWLGTGGTSTTGAASATVPAFLDNMMASYIKTHPTPTAAAAIQQTDIYNQFMNTIGRPPTAADYAALGTGSTPDQINNYIRTLPYQSGMNYGDYQDARQRLDTMWMQNYGHLPSQQDYLWSVGKTQDQIQEHVDNSQSRVGGLTIGKYNAVKTAADSLLTKYFGYGANDALISHLHQMATTQ